MIITWLPSDTFNESVETLSPGDLSMQRKHILALLEFFHEPEESSLPKDYRPGDKLSGHHPSVRMWRGFDLQLCELGLQACDEWSRRHKNKIDPYYKKLATHMEWALTDESNMEKPNWLGDVDFHLSHQAALLTRDRDHYHSYYVSDVERELVWPVSVHA